jgi:hypothetical protein
MQNSVHAVSLVLPRGYNALYVYKSEQCSSRTDMVSPARACLSQYMRQIHDVVVTD